LGNKPTSLIVYPVTKGNQSKRKRKDMGQLQQKGKEWAKGGRRRKEEDVSYCQTTTSGWHVSEIIHPQVFADGCQALALKEKISRQVATQICPAGERRSQSIDSPIRKSPSEL